MGSNDTINNAHDCGKLENLSIITELHFHLMRRFILIALDTWICFFTTNTVPFVSTEHRYYLFRFNQIKGLLNYVFFIQSSVSLFDLIFLLIIEATVMTLISEWTLLATPQTFTVFLKIFNNISLLFTFTNYTNNFTLWLKNVL